MNNPRIIVALDFPDMEQGKQLIDQLEPGLCRLKVGKELFTSGGPALVETLQGRGFEVFLDLKFHDIPTTVARACGVAARLGVWMLNMHASGGRSMLLAAREAVVKERHQPILLGVTVLTSLSSVDLAETGITGTVEEQVVRLAALCRDSGLDGVVCSAREAAVLKAGLGSDFILVTPGIRPAGTVADDQQRVLTPAEAIAAGSHYLVVGRPVTRAMEPLAVLQQIHDDINAAAQRSQAIS